MVRPRPTTGTSVTIAGLAGAAAVEAQHVAEALSYRAPAELERWL